MGVIVRLEKETFRILTMNGKIVNMSHSAITKKRPNKYAAALDSESKTINIGDIVKIIDGVHRVLRRCLCFYKEIDLVTLFLK
jgi:transcription elongation factor SPT5